MARGTKSRIHDGEGRIIGDRGGARNEELGEVYQHLGGGRIDRSGELKGGGFRGRWRSVFNETTRQTLEQDYPPGSIIVKRTNPVAVALRNMTGWPGSESGRLSGRELVRRNQIKVGVAGFLTVWSGLSYEASPVAFLPTPTEAAAAGVGVIDQGFEWRYGGDDSANQTADTPPTTLPNPNVTEPTNSAPPVSVDLNPTATSLAPFGEGGAVVTTPSSNALPLPTSPNTVPTVTSPETVGSTAAFTFGEMSCNATVQVTIAEGEFPFTALARATGEPLDDLVDGDAFWGAIVNSLNGGSVGTNPGETYTGPDNCQNYQTINNGFIG